MIAPAKFEKQNVIQVRVNISEVSAVATFPAGQFYMMTFGGKIKHAITRERNKFGSEGQGYDFIELNKAKLHMDLLDVTNINSIELPENFTGKYYLNLDGEILLDITMMINQSEIKVVLVVLALCNKSTKIQLSLGLKPNDDNHIKNNHEGLVYGWSLFNENNFVVDDSRV